MVFLSLCILTRISPKTDIQRDRSGPHVVFSDDTHVSPSSPCQLTLYLWWGPSDTRPGPTNNDRCVWKTHSEDNHILTMFYPPIFHVPLIVLYSIPYPQYSFHRFPHLLYSFHTWLPSCYPRWGRIPESWHRDLVTRPRERDDDELIQRNDRKSKTKTEGDT